MRHLLKPAALIGLALLLAGGQAAAIDSGSPDGDGHPFVGWMYGETPTGAQTVGCSVLLVAPTIAITSGACTDIFSQASNVASVWVTFEPANLVPFPIDPPTSPPSVEVVQLVTDPDYLSSGGVSGNVGVLVLDEAQPGPYATLPAAGRLDALDGSEAYTAVAYGTERHQTIETLERRYSGATLRGVGPDSLFLRLTKKGHGPAACAGSQAEGGGGFIGESEAVALVLDESWRCSRNVTLQRLDVQDVRDFLGDYVTLP